MLSGDMPSLSTLFGDRLTAVMPRGAGRLASPDLPGVGAALAAAALARRAPSRVALAVTPGPADHERVYADLCALGRDSGVTPETFPPAAANDAESTGVRARVIAALAAGGEPQHATPGERFPTVIVTSLQALVQPAPTPEALAEASLSLHVGARYAFDDVVARLVAAGYERSAEVDAPGRLAVRGGLLDIWPSAAPAPWRAESICLIA